MLPRFVTMLLMALLVPLLALAEEAKPPAYPVAAGPYVGDWKGVWSSGEDKHPEIAAQVIARGGGEYEIVLLPVLYARTPPFATVAAKEADGKLRFNDGLYHGEIDGDAFTGGRTGEDEGAFSLEPFTLVSPTLGAKPPKDAVVLFDGSGFEAFRRFPRNKSWGIVNGKVMQANPDIGYIMTDEDFGSVTLHMEFRLPFLPAERGQERGNSGIFLQRYFEVQILDSYGLPGYWNECGAIYRISPPQVNMCLPPLQWQTFDIEFTAARYDDDGESILELPRMSVRHNGVYVQKDIELPHGTSRDAKKKAVPPPPRPEPLRIQAHKNHVQFRNIWLVQSEAE